MVEWSVLRSLPEEDRRRLLAAARRRRFARREVLFHEGDPGDALHLIATGHVAIRISTPLGDVATVAVRGPGEVVGELALVDSSDRRSATVVALERTETLSLHREQFEELRRRHPDVQTFIGVLLAAAVRASDQRIVEALYVPAETRVLRRLLDLARTFGDGQPGAEVPMTQEDIASMAGTSRATVNRVLREAEDAGLVALRRGGVVVLDPATLGRRAR